MDQTSTEYMDAISVEIGNLVIGVSLFDDDIASIISQSLRLNKLQENALVRPLSTRSKADLLTRVGKLFLAPPEVKKLSKWCENVKRALDDRNNLIHGAPGHIDGKVHFRTWSGKNRMLGHSEPWPVDKVGRLSDRFIALNKELETELLALFSVTFSPPEETEGAPEGPDLANVYPDGLNEG